MKPTIDPISGMPYLSHVNDIETIAALRAENERLKAESLADGLPASWWMNTAKTQAIECNEDEERLRAEVERLTDILIACCNAAGGQAVRGVSVDFLARVPAEITGRIERLTKERDEARAAIESDRTKMADAVTAIDKALDSRFWLTEGRGSYAWDDERYRQEFRDAAIEILGAIKALRSLAADWSNSPMTGAEVAQARIDLKAERDQLREQLEAVCDAAEPVIHRWDSPSWQWDTPTGVLVNALRAAIKRARSK